MGMVRLAAMAAFVLMPLGAGAQRFGSSENRINPNMDGTSRPTLEVCQKLRSFAENNEFQNKTDLGSESGEFKKNQLSFTELTGGKINELKPIALFFLGPEKFVKGRWSAIADSKSDAQSNRGFRATSSFKVRAPAEVVEGDRDFSIYSAPLDKIGPVEGLDPAKFADFALVIDTDSDAPCNQSESAEPAGTPVPVVVVTDKTAQAGTADPAGDQGPVETPKIKLENIALLLPRDVLLAEPEIQEIEAFGRFVTEKDVGATNDLVHKVLNAGTRELLSKISEGDIVVPHVMLNLPFKDSVREIAEGTVPEVDIRLTFESKDTIRLPMKARLYFDATKTRYGLLFGARVGDWNENKPAPVSESESDLNTVAAAESPEPPVKEDPNTEQLENPAAPAGPVELGSKLATLELKSEIFGVPNVDLAYSQHGKCDFALTFPSNDAQSFEAVNFAKDNDSGARVVDIFKDNGEFFRPSLVTEEGQLISPEVVNVKMSDALATATLSIKERNKCEFAGLDIPLAEEMVSFDPDGELKISVTMPPRRPTFTLLIEVPPESKDQLQQEYEETLEELWTVIDAKFKSAQARSPKAAAAVFAIAEPGIKDGDDVPFLAVPFANSEQQEGAKSKIFEREDLRPFSYLHIGTARDELIAKGGTLSVKNWTVGLAAETLRGGLASGVQTAQDAVPDRVIFLGFKATSSLACSTGVFKQVQETMPGSGRPIRLQRIIAITDERAKEFSKDDVDRYNRSAIGICTKSKPTQEPTILVSVVDRMNGDIEWEKIRQDVREHLMELN